MHANKRQVRCANSRCALQCHEACAPCVEKCTWACEHQGDCSMPCSAPCSRLPCDQGTWVWQRCIIRMGWGPSLDFRTSLALWHGLSLAVQTVNVLSGITAHSVSIGSSKEQSLMKCRSVLVHGKQQLRKLEQQIARLEHDFQGSRKTVLDSIRSIPNLAAANVLKSNLTTSTLDITRKLKQRYTRSNVQEKTIRRFCEKVADKTQSAQKLHDATVNALTRRSNGRLTTDLRTSG